MKRLFICCFLILPGLCFAQDYTINFEHNAFLVRDVDKAASFYLDILKLQEIEVPGAPETRRWFSLGGSLQLHLIEGDNAHIVHDKSVHMACRTSDLSALISELRKRNYPFESWQGEKNNFNVRADGIRQIYLQDPDGYWLEINDTSR
jgi:lactoylglutathione lyase